MASSASSRDDRVLDVIFNPDEPLLGLGVSTTLTQKNLATPVCIFDTIIICPRAHPDFTSYTSITPSQSTNWLYHNFKILQFSFLNSLIVRIVLVVMMVEVWRM